MKNKDLHIGIIELAHHNEVVRSYLISLLTCHVSVHLFTSSWNQEQLYDFIDHPNIEWYIRKDKQTNTDFLRDKKNEIDACSFVICTSIETDDNGLVQFTTKTKTGLVVHDVHTLFEYKKHLNFDCLQNILRTVKHLALNKLKEKALASQSFDHYFLPSKNVLEYLKSKNYFSEKFIVAPFAINDEISLPHQRNHVNITIPGNVDDKSRDYKTVIKAFQHLKSLNKKIILTLLGRPSSRYGKKIIRSFKNLENDHFQLISFTSFIPQHNFDTIMRDADFLICPMNKIMKFGPVKELNGYSCVSGNINDIVRYGLPALIPSSYPINNNWRLAVGAYDSEKKLAELITLWVNNDVYNSIKTNNAAKAFSENTKDLNGKKLLDVILDRF